MKHKDMVHFGTSEGDRGPLETIFMQIVFKTSVFDTFGKMSSNVVVETVRTTLRRRYNAQLSMAAWRGYADLLLDRTKYVGTG